ncbi:MAG TPA: MEDS domain-containing protein [Dehalococcoidia bacterium]|jgi:hypothetical protein|nr:MEDS domain-containing protein [Dehalococcoidia bacterium]
MNTLTPGSHVCLLYRDAVEQKAAVLPFVRDGLNNNEQVVYVADEQLPDEWYFEFQAYGIDVESERNTRRLIVCSGERWRTQEAFSSIRNARSTWNMIEESLGTFRGIRFVVDAGWMLDPPVPDDLVCHWEATLNVVVDGGIDAMVMCQYNMARHSSAAVHSALRTHPVVYIGQELRTNPYFEAPKILENEPFLNHSMAEPGQVEGMLIALAQAEPLSAP